MKYELIVKIYNSWTLYGTYPLEQARRMARTLRICGNATMVRPKGFYKDATT